MINALKFEPSSVGRKVSFVFFGKNVLWSSEFLTTKKQVIITNQM